MRFPQAITRRTGPLSLDVELDQILAAETARHYGADLDPAGAFVGRDWRTCQLETAARLQKVIVLHGPAALVRPSWPRRSAGGGGTRAGWTSPSMSSSTHSSPAWPRSVWTAFSLVSRIRGGPIGPSPALAARLALIHEEGRTGRCPRVLTDER